MAFNGRTILPFKVGALEIVDSDGDSVSSLVVDLRQKVGCDEVAEESGAILVDDGEKKAKAVVVAAECSNIRRAEERIREDDEVFMLLVILL